MKIAIVGAGIFGCEIALSLNRAGHAVHLFESNSNILSGASKVNQARIHTGMHYPRDFRTAQNSFEAHDDFIRRYPSPITYSLDQFYAVASEGSKTTPDSFIKHADNLGIKFEECDPSRFFRFGMVDCLIKVPESTLDYRQLRNYYLTEFGNAKNFRLRKNTKVEKVLSRPSGIFLLSGNEEERFDYVVVATYSSLFALLKEHIDEISDDLYFEYQACEVALGLIPSLINTGVTVMDGNYWSTMPFGGSGLHSLTNVPRTPHLSLSSYDSELVSRTANLTSEHRAFIIDFEKYMKDEFKFEYVRSLFTVKTLAQNSQKHAARPTEIFRALDGRVLGVFSGKIASALEAAEKIRVLLL